MTQTTEKRGIEDKTVATGSSVVAAENPNDVVYLKGLQLALLTSGLTESYA